VRVFYESTNMCLEKYIRFMSVVLHSPITNVRCETQTYKTQTFIWSFCDCYCFWMFPNVTQYSL